MHVIIERQIESSVTEFPTSSNASTIIWYDRYNQNKNFIVLLFISSAPFLLVILFILILFAILSRIFTIRKMHRRRKKTKNDLIMRNTMEKRFPKRSNTTQANLMPTLRRQNTIDDNEYSIDKADVCVTSDQTTDSNSNTITSNVDEIKKKRRRNRKKSNASGDDDTSSASGSVSSSSSSTTSDENTTKKEGIFDKLFRRRKHSSTSSSEVNIQDQTKSSESNNNTHERSKHEYVNECAELTKSDLELNNNNDEAKRTNNEENVDNLIKKHHQQPPPVIVISEVNETTNSNLNEN